MKPGLESYRIEKARNLMAFWAWYHYLQHQQRTAELVAGSTGRSILVGFVGGKVYKPFCFKKKTNAQQTRSKRSSTEPVGGRIGSLSKVDRVNEIDALFDANFSDRACRLLLGLFVPPEAYLECIDREKRRVLKDSEIARLLGFKPARACQIKIQSIGLVVTELLSPANERLAII